MEEFFSDNGILPGTRAAKLQFASKDLAGCAF